MPVVINGSTGITSPGGDTSAADNTINGVRVGEGAGSIATNTAVGASALNANTTGDSNAAFGQQALAANTTGYANTATGQLSLLTNTTGLFNTGNGASALRLNTTGSYNSAFGVYALYSNTTASNNTAVGYQALYTSTTGANNTALGYRAGYVVTGGDNVFIGVNTGADATTGTSNTFVGRNAGGAVSTGSKNTILGRYDGNSGGLDIRTSSNYIVLSDGDGNPRVAVNNGGYLKAMPNFADVLSLGGSYHELISNDAANNTLYVSNKSTTTTTNGMVRLDAYRNTTNNTFYVLSYYNQGAGAYKFQVADSGNVTNTNGSYGTISDAKNKENIVDATPKLDKVKQLQVRNFNFKNDELKQIGFIAQEFEQIFPSMVEEHKDTDEEGNDLGTTTKSIKTSVLVPILVKAVQELTAKVEALEAQLNK